MIEGKDSFHALPNGLSHFSLLKQQIKADGIIQE
jgi:hypothetical protein